MLAMQEPRATVDLWVPRSVAVGEAAVRAPTNGRSVIDRPTATPGGPPQSMADSLLYVVAGAGDEITPWGIAPKRRDRELREFVPTESYFSSALGSVGGRNAALPWALEGPDRTARKVKDVLDNANEGKGWQDLIMKLSADLYSQDYGAFMEVVRAADSPRAGLVGLNHLDAFRCWHTGDPKAPVLYLDRKNEYHLLKWYQVVTFSDMPTPIEGLYGLQMCALTRMLQGAHVLKAVLQYHKEKVSGRFTRAIHIVKGVGKKTLDDALAALAIELDDRGIFRYTQPLVVTGMDPSADIDVKTLAMASLPDGFSQEEMFRWYIVLMAMSFMGDYQDFAPLPGGALGSSQQSEILHLKSTTKGAALFRQLITHALNFQILPTNVEFRYTVADVEHEKTQAELEKIHAETRQVQIADQEISPEAARQVAVDKGDISTEVFEGMGGKDVTPGSLLRDDQQPGAGQGTPAGALAPPETPESPPAAGEAELEEDEDEVEEGEAAALAGPFRG